MVHEKGGSAQKSHWVLGFEIPVTRGAFDQGEGSTDDISITKKENNAGRNVLRNTGHNVHMPESWRAQAT